MSDEFVDKKAPVESKAASRYSVGEAEAQPGHIQVITLHADGVDVIFEEQAARLNQSIQEIGMYNLGVPPAYMR